jgi:acetyl-CoA acetyltransferase family protein
MGRTAETLAEQHGISRDEQDRFALESQRKAAAAWESGAFADELLAMEVPGKGGATTTLAKDEHMRPETTLAGLGKLKPVFKEGGTVHAGNSSGVTDGAAAVVVASGDAAARHGLKPLARVAGWAVAGVDPKVMGIGPVPATRKVLEKTGLSMDDLDLVELNEAFAAQAIACDRELRLDPARLNVHGGAIALGHPIGATGCRIVVTLVHALRRRGARRGLATLCVSGGMGISVLVEAV